MIKRQKEKGRSKRGEAETFTYEQVQLARNEYKDEASLFLSCLKSLKQSQSRTLLTQAVRNHAAQVFLYLMIVIIKRFLILFFYAMFVG